MAIYSGIIRIKDGATVSMPFAADPDRVDRSKLEAMAAAGGASLALACDRMSELLGLRGVPRTRSFGLNGGVLIRSRRTIEQIAAAMGGVPDWIEVEVSGLSDDQMAAYIAEHYPQAQEAL